MTFAGVDPLLILIAGLALDALFGDTPAIFRYVSHPVVIAGRAIAFFDRKLNREARGEASRRERGVVTVIVLVGGAAVLGLAIERVCRGSLPGAALETILTPVLIPQHGPYQHVTAAAVAVHTGGILP